MTQVKEKRRRQKNNSFFLKFLPLMVIPGLQACPGLDPGESSSFNLDSRFRGNDGSKVFMEISIGRSFLFP
jgi:hypothetical protein